MNCSPPRFLRAICGVGKPSRGAIVLSAVRCLSCVARCQVDSRRRSCWELTGPPACVSRAASMPTQTHIFDQTYVPLGQRRGIFDLERFSLDLTWGRADTECAAHTQAYPSPPMSGSPPLPPKPTQEAADRGQGGFQATSHDVYRTTTAIPGVDYRGPLTHPPVRPQSPASVIRQLPPAEAQPYAFRRPEDVLGRPLSFPQQQTDQFAPQPQYSLPQVAGPSQIPPQYGISGNPQGLENVPYTSPKSRKPKGHVASACVPCKKAHLR